MVVSMTAPAPAVDLIISPPVMTGPELIPNPLVIFVIPAPAAAVTATVPAPSLLEVLNAPAMTVTAAIPAPAITQTLSISSPVMAVTEVIPAPTVTLTAQPPVMTTTVTAPVPAIALTAAAPVMAVTATIPSPTVPFASYDATGAGYTGTGSPSWAHTIAGNGVVVFVDTWVSSSSPTVTASVGGTAMTLQGVISNYYTSGGDYASVYAFVLENPPTGSQTISATCSGTTPWIAANSVSYNNVSGFGTAVTQAFTTANPSMSASSATGQMVAQAFGGYATANFSAYSQTQRYNKSTAFGNLAFVMGDASGAGSVTFSATNAFAACGGIAIPIL